MKKNLLFSVFCLYAGLLNAQPNREAMFPKNAKYFIKDGPEIPYDKIDSVVISWGGTFGKMISTGSGEEKIYLMPPGPSEKQAKSLTEKANAMLGKIAPDFDLTDLYRKKYRLSDLKGKVVVLNFWFTACVPCIAEMPELNTIKEKYKDQEVVFLGLGRDDTNTIKDFLKNHAFSYTLIPGATETADTYSVSIYPTSMVIDREGIIRYVHVSGTGIGELLTKEIKKVL